MEKKCTYFYDIPSKADGKRKSGGMRHGEESASIRGRERTVINEWFMIRRKKEVAKSTSGEGKFESY